MDILTQWQIEYCAGSPMPLSFRIQASQYFQEYYNQIKINNPQSKIIVSNSTIYRIIEGKFDETEVSKNLYYSFSKIKKGLLYFAKKDRHYNSDITLIIANPLRST